ncbi:hypothetical protein ACOMHN_052564 [Nucella lapillus]
MNRRTSRDYDVQTKDGRSYRRNRVFIRHTPRPRYPPHTPTAVLPPKTLSTCPHLGHHTPDGDVDSAPPDVDRGQTSRGEPTTTPLRNPVMPEPNTPTPTIRQSHGLQSPTSPVPTEASKDTNITTRSGRAVKPRNVLDL